MRRGLGDFAMEFYYHEIDRTVLILGVTRIIVDCTHLEYISSYGIGLLVRLHNKLAKHGGDVKIAAPGGFVMKALSVMHMAKIFDIYPDVDQARLAFRPKDAQKS
jgi:anti-anti-sigma factor